MDKDYVGLKGTTEAQCCNSVKEPTLKEQLEEELKSLVRRANAIRQKIELVENNPVIEQFIKLY